MELNMGGSTLERYTETFYDPEKKIWSGPKRKFMYSEEVTVGEVAQFVLSRNTEKVIQVDDDTGEELTAGQLLHDSQVVAYNLVKLGLQAGDVMGLYADNSKYTACVVLSAFLCGTPLNSVYPGFDRDVVEIIYKTSTPRIIFCDADNYPNAKAVSEELDLKAFIYLMSGEIPGVPRITDLLKNKESICLEDYKFPCSKLNGHDMALILCSSGTTGLPKGVICSNKSLLELNFMFSVKANSVLLSFSTMYWASGIWTMVTSLLKGVKRITTTHPFTPEYFVEIVERHRITHVLTGTFHMAQLSLKTIPNIEKRLASLDTLFCGGSKVPRVVSDKMHAILGNIGNRPKFSVAYGMSENPDLFSCDTGGTGHEGTEGKLGPNTEVRVVNKEGVPLGPNERGELQIRMALKWRGYYRNPEATRRALVDGWYATGDVGYFDDLGFLHLCGRESEVFKTSGFHIFPGQLEEIIAHLPGVQEVCVFGLPDFEASFLTACAVVRTDDEAGAKLTAADIIGVIEKNLSKVYHVKGGVFFVDSLPKSPTGKVRRTEVLEMIESLQGKINS